MLPEVTIVVPTIGRPSLHVLLTSIAASARHTGRRPPPIVLVDDRQARSADLAVGDIELPSVTVLRSGGRGPAAARNIGWRHSGGEWVAFLDDDVLVGQDWLHRLAYDIGCAGTSVGGIQGRITVPLPEDRRPRDWERGTAGLEIARWITADMAYRRGALRRIGGFDERFPRAFREDADLALRMLDNGYQLTVGERRTTHPVRPAGWWASVHQQRGNADDVLMRRLHGRHWRRRAQAPVGRRPQHLAATGLALVAVIAGSGRRPRIAAAAAGGWALLTAEFSWRRIQPGPRDAREVLRMLSTSVLIPPVACWYWVRGLLTPHAENPLPAGEPPTLPAAVLVDRDGTIVKDVPYNGDPDSVEPMPGAGDALARLRAAGLPIAVISNQSGIGRGLISPASVAAVNARIEQLLGPFDAWLCCPHVDGDGCRCRKPKAGLVFQAAEQLGVRADRCIVIGDIGADMGSALAAGAGGILVPTPATRPDEIAAAPMCAATIGDAVDMILTGAGLP